MIPWTSAFTVLVCIVGAIMSALPLLAHTVFTYNPLDRPACRRLDDVDSVSEAIAQWRRRLGEHMPLLKAPSRAADGQTYAIVELPRGGRA